MKEILNIKYGQSEIADRKLCSELFCHWSHYERLTLSFLHFGSGQHLSFLFCHSFTSDQDSVYHFYSVIPLLRLRQRLTLFSVISSLWSRQHLSVFFCHSDPERSEGEESPHETLRLTPQGDRKEAILSAAKDLQPFQQTGFSIRKFLRFAQDSA